MALIVLYIKIADLSFPSCNHPKLLLLPVMHGFRLTSIFIASPSWPSKFVISDFTLVHSRCLHLSHDLQIRIHYLTNRDEAFLHNVQIQSNEAVSKP